MIDWEIGEVVIVSGRSYVAPLLEKVARVTKTQVILESGKRYNRKTLMKVGGDVWSLSRIQKATPQQIEEVEIESKIRSIRYRLKQEKWDYPIERLNQIIDLLDAKGGQS